MPNHLDQLFSHLREAPTDMPLDQLEPAVWSRIDATRRDAPRDAVWGWRAALAAVMLTTGAFAGGVAAAQSEASSPFAIHAALAPSTLLESGR